MHLKALSGFLVLLFSVNSFYQIQSFGFSAGTYFWFCNFALLFGGVAIAFNRRDFLLLILSVLIPTQSFWFFDHIKRAFSGSDFFGLSEAVFWSKNIGVGRYDGAWGAF